MIVSHHGELEFGSPKVPQFPEALLLHHLDNLDSKMECMRSLVAKDRHVEGCWTGYNSSLERSLLKKAKYLEEEPAGPPMEIAPLLSLPVQQIPAPQPPGQPAPAAHPMAEKHTAPSPFAEKLKEAWRKDS